MENIHDLFVKVIDRLEYLQQREEQLNAYIQSEIKPFSTEYIASIREGIQIVREFTIFHKMIVKIYPESEEYLRRTKY